MRVRDDLSFLAIIFSKRSKLFVMNSLNSWNQISCIIIRHFIQKSFQKQTGASSIVTVWGWGLLMHKEVVICWLRLWVYWSFSVAKSCEWNKFFRRLDGGSTEAEKLNLPLLWFLCLKRNVISKVRRTKNLYLKWVALNIWQFESNKLFGQTEIFNP